VWTTGGAHGTGAAQSGALAADEQREQLESPANSRSLPAGLVQRAHVVLQCADGALNQDVAKLSGLSNATVGKSRR